MSTERRCPISSITRTEKLPNGNKQQYLDIDCTECLRGGRYVLDAGTTKRGVQQTMRDICIRRNK